MKSPSRVIKVAISFVAITAWLSAANHCLFGDSVLARPIPAHAGCPGHKAPDKSGDKDGNVACCKSFPTASLSPAKSLVISSAGFSAAYFASFTAIVPPARSQLDLQPLELDTGPPFARSLVEFVLQRSLQAHAPPVSA